jgi:ketosteroid isomerase-like protein
MPMNKVEISRQVYAAINENRISDVLKYFDADVVRIEDFSSPGTHRGHTEVLKHLSQARSTWAEGRCEPVGFIAAGDKMIVLVHVRVRLKDRTEWVDGRLADVFSFRDTKVVEMRAFAETQNALLWSGLAHQ